MSLEAQDSWQLLKASFLALSISISIAISISAPLQSSV